MTARVARMRHAPVGLSDRQWSRLIHWTFFFGAALVVFGIFLLTLHPFEAYLAGAPASDSALTHRLRNNSTHAGIFFVHIYAGNMALALGTLQLVRPLRARFPGLHRWIGRAYVVAVMIAVVMSYGLAPRLDVWGTALGRQVGATLWGAFTILAVVAIRRGEVEAHRRWMLRSYAFAYMGITFMVLSAIRSTSGVALEIGYPIVIHMSFVINMAVCEVLLRRMGPRAAERPI